MCFKASFLEMLFVPNNLMIYLSSANIYVSKYNKTISCLSVLCIKKQIMLQVCQELIYYFYSLYRGHKFMAEIISFMLCSVGVAVFMLQKIKILYIHNSVLAILCSIVVLLNCNDEPISVMAEN